MSAIVENGLNITLSMEDEIEKRRKDDCLKIAHVCGTCLLCGTNYLCYDYESSEHHIERNACGTCLIVFVVITVVIIPLFLAFQCLYLGYRFYFGYLRACGCSSFVFNNCSFDCYNTTQPIDTSYSFDDQWDFIVGAFLITAFIVSLIISIIIVVMGYYMCKRIDEYYENKIIEEGIKL